MIVAGGLLTYDYDDVGKLLTKISTMEDPNFPDIPDDPNTIDPEDPNGYIVETFSYDTLGNMLTAEKGSQFDFDRISKTTFEYDGLGNMIQTTQRVGDGDVYITDFTRRADGKAVHIDYPYVASPSYSLDYSYTSLGQVETISRDDVTLVAYEYAGRMPLSRSYPQVSAVQSWDYDEFGRVDDIAAVSDSDPNDPFTHFAYGYDADSNITSQQYLHKTNSPTNTYGYDTLDRLTSAEYFSDSSDTESFDYDDLGKPGKCQSARWYYRKLCCKRRK